MQVQARQLRAGDILKNGNKVYMSAMELTTTPKGKVTIGIEFTNGKRMECNWNKSTTIKLK